ncbi:MAG: GNAT family N-acetyltransferase [Vicinamibacterales bacterium]
MAARTNSLGQPIGNHVVDWTPPPHPPGKVLAGRYCRVEPLDRAHHAAHLFDANSRDVEGRNWTYLSVGPFASHEDYTRWVAEVAQSDDPQFYAITVDDRAVGVAAYLRIMPAAGSIEVGHINFSPLLQRTFAATESMFLMMQYAFALGYRRYEWKCDALNAPSRAAAQRLGLSFEGVFRQALVYKDRNRDTAWYATIDREWPALRHAFERWLDPSNFDQHGQQRVSLSTLTAPLLVSRG